MLAYWFLKRPRRRSDAGGSAASRAADAEAAGARGGAAQPPAARLPARPDQDPEAPGDHAGGRRPGPGRHAGHDAAAGHQPAGRLRPEQHDGQAGAACRAPAWTTPAAAAKKVETALPRHRRRQGRPGDRRQRHRRLLRAALLRRLQLHVHGRSPTRKRTRRRCRTPSATRLAKGPDAGKITVGSQPAASAPPPPWTSPSRPPLGGPADAPATPGQGHGRRPRAQRRSPATWPPPSPWCRSAWTGPRRSPRA